MTIHNIDDVEDGGDVIGVTDADDHNVADGYGRFFYCVF